MKKYIALALVFATPAVLAETINMACPPGDKVVIHTVKNNGDFNHSGNVGTDDAAILGANIGKATVPVHSPDRDPLDTTYLTDLNADGITDLTDYSLFRMLWSQQ
jgi:hypothetical protein